MRSRRGFGDRPIIAEDLGFLTPTVLQLVKDTGYPGMKLLQFAFDSVSRVIICRTIIRTTVSSTPVPMITIRLWLEGACECGGSGLYPQISEYSSGRCLNWSMIRAAFALWQIQSLFRCRIIWDLAPRHGSTRRRPWPELAVAHEAGCHRFGSGRPDPGADRAVRKNVSQMQYIRKENAYAGISV